MKNKLKIALLQNKLANGFDNIDKLEKQILENIENLSSDIDLLCLAEMPLGGFSFRDRDKLALRWEEYKGKLQLAAKKKKLAISITALEKEKKQYFNTHYFFNKNGIEQAKYRKIHLIGIGGFKETSYFSSGKDLQCIDFEGWKIALTTCYDLRFPELFRKYFKMNAELILLPSQWPDVRKYHLEILSKARAIENQCYFINTNVWGTQGKLSFNGESRVIDYLGKELATAALSKDDILIAELDREKLVKYKNNFPVLKDIKLI